MIDSLQAALNEADKVMQLTPEDQELAASQALLNTRLTAATEAKPTIDNEVQEQQETVEKANYRVDDQRSRILALANRRLAFGEFVVEARGVCRQGTAFDIVVDDPHTPPSGYDKLIFAQADGKLRIERQGQASEVRDQPRAVNRPNLGPEPRLRIEVTKPDADSSDPIRFRAVGKLGTGEWAGERPEPLVSWEVYGPANRVRPSIFPEYGSTYLLQIEQSVPFTLAHPIPEHLRERKNDTTRLWRELIQFVQPWPTYSDVRPSLIRRSICRIRNPLKGLNSTTKGAR